MADEFPDRRDHLFGREPDIRRLIDRARGPGLTALVGRPMMGKTWTLHETARRLMEEGRFLVGYHESKGSETSPLLYAVSNLYTRWLADSTMRGQALSLWQRHKAALVPRVGQMVGSLFDKLAGTLLPDGVASTVRSAFDGLAEAQRDLLGGGLQLAPLPYDQARSLLALVAEISGRRLVLILDAWEKSSALRAEHATLESVLQHRDDWATTHVVLAIRDPQQGMGGKAADEALQHAENLCELSAQAVIQRLDASISEDARESRRMLDHVRSRVPAAGGEPDATLLGWVDGYPGVLDRWTSAESAAHPLAGADLQRLAADAQALRYTDLHRLLGGLQDGPLALAARLACFPRLDAEGWQVHKPLLLKQQDESGVHALLDASVLDPQDDVPSYGHDTRHAAARRWLVKHRLPLLRRTAEDLVRCLAALCTGIDAASRPHFETLAALDGMAVEAGVDPAVHCFIDAARAAFGDHAGVLHAAFDHAYREAVRRTPSAASLMARALFNRGVTNGQRGDPDAAIADFSAVIELPGVPVDWVAQALVNRGVTNSQRGKPDAAIADYAAVIELPGAPVDWVAHALVNRGVTNGQRGKPDAAIADYAAVIELPGAPVDSVAQALVNRGVTNGQRGKPDAAIADYAAVIELPGVPVDWVAQALVNRGITNGQRGDPDAAIADFSAVIELPGAPVDSVAQALVNRGYRNGQRGKPDAAIADFSAVIELPGAPPDVIEFARDALNRLRAPGSDGA